MVIDPMHRAIFPNFLVAEDSSAVRRFNTSLDGSYFAVGRGGSITGRGADLFLIDDPLKDADEARSEMIRHRCATGTRKSSAPGFTAAARS